MLVSRWLDKKVTSVDAERLRDRRECGLGPPYFRRSFYPRIPNREEGAALRTIKAWIQCLIFVVMAACFCWVWPSVYSMKYPVSADRVYVDPKPTDCDFWHAPIGKKGCQYQTAVIGRYAKQIREIRPAESDRNERFDSVLISWVKKSD